jgi:hypothetical protein
VHRLDRADLIRVHARDRAPRGSSRRAPAHATAAGATGARPGATRPASSSSPGPHLHRTTPSCRTAKQPPWFAYDAHSAVSPASFRARCPPSAPLMGCLAGTRFRLVALAQIRHRRRPEGQLRDQAPPGFLLGTVPHPDVLSAHPQHPASGARVSDPCRTSAVDHRLRVRRPSLSPTGAGIAGTALWPPMAARCTPGRRIPPVHRSVAGPQ